jgi:hypothetical protein
MTFLAALLHSGMFLSPHGSDTRVSAVQSAEAGRPGSLQTPSPAGHQARFQSDDDGDDQDPGHDVPPGHRHHHAVLRAPTSRTDVSGAAGPSLTCIPVALAHDARLVELPRAGDRPRRAAGASLLTLIGVSRT